MRIAALYDIHANLPALEAVLDEVRRVGVDRIVIGGDVLPGPLPRDTLTRLQELEWPVAFIRGNGDRETLASMRGTENPALPEAAREGIRWTAQQLHAADELMLESWPGTLRIEMPVLGDVLFCHATPRNDTDIFTRRTPEDRLVPLFEGLGVALVICGHSHMQFDRMIGQTRVVNAGSVGMPFGAPGADWLLLGPGVELRHTSYDLAAAAERVRATAFPQAEEFAARYVLRPPSEAEILDAYSAAELK